MNRILRIALLLLIAAAGLIAQTDSVNAPASLTMDQSGSAQKEVFVWGGTTIPYLPKEFTNYWRRGWNGAVGYGLSFDPGTLGYGAVAAVVEYNRCPIDIAGYREAMAALYPGQAAAARNGSLLARGAATSLTAMIEFKGAFSSTKRTIAPYFLLGVGYIRFANDSIAIAGVNAFTVPEQSESGVAWSIGVGIELPVTSTFGLFVQGRSVIAQLDKTRQYFPVSAGLRMGL